jgi:hypothetical protein
VTSAAEPITVLTEDESWYLLASMTLGRLVTVVAGQPEVFPVNFVVQRPTVLFRTAEDRPIPAAAGPYLWRQPATGDGHGQVSEQLRLAGRSSPLTPDGGIERGLRVLVSSYKQLPRRRVRSGRGT